MKARQNPLTMKTKLHPLTVSEGVRLSEFQGYKLNKPEQPLVDVVKVRTHKQKYKKEKIDDSDVKAAEFMEENPDKRGRRTGDSYQGKTPGLTWNPTRDFRPSEHSAGLAQTSGVNRGGISSNKKTMASNRYAKTPSEATAHAPNPFPQKARKNIMLRSKKK